MVVFTLDDFWLVLLGTGLVPAIYLWKGGMLLPVLFWAAILAVLWAAWLWLDILKR